MQLTYLIAYVKEPNNTFSIYIPDILQKPVYNNPRNNISSICDLVFFSGISRFVSENDAYPKPLLHSNELLFNYVKRHREKAGLTTECAFTKEMKMHLNNDVSLLVNKILKTGCIDNQQKVYHPSKILYLKFMKPANMSAAELVSTSGLITTYEIAYLHDFLKAQNPITPDLASRFSVVFNTSLDFWTTLQKEYDEYTLEKYLSEATRTENVPPIYYKSVRDNK